MIYKRMFAREAAICLMLCSAVAARADLKSASLNVEQQTTVPGGDLKPGVYTIGVVDHLNDRVVLHVDDSTGKTHLVFLGVSKPGTEGGSGSHAVQWNTGAEHKHFMRGYDFGSDYIEFVYPKNVAVAIAKANNAGVVAIDPKSESRPELKNLTSLDRQMVTLWMLTPVQIGTEHGLEAKHYAAISTPLVARTTPQPASFAHGGEPTSVAVQTPARSRPSKPVVPAQLAQDRAPARPRAYQPAIKRLPQTASEMPLLWGIGFAALFAAAALRFRKMVFQG